MVVTHEFGRNGTLAQFHNSPLGVVFDANLGRWKIFNQDGAAMPTNISFIVAVRP